MSCYVKINDIPYTKEEFQEAIRKEGMAIFPPPTSKLGRAMFFKYDYKTAEPSIMEVVYKLVNPSGSDMPSKSEIDATLYRSSAFTDYASQKEIHSNTYSGVKITGIAANFGKTLGYMFDSTKITKIKDPEGNEYDLYSNINNRSYLNYLKEIHGVNSVTDLIVRKGFEVVEREPVKLKFKLRLGGNTLGAFSRNEIDPDTGEALRVPHADYEINVFETIDTIINLAIDNVKEMKLFILGITNANANTFLTALAFGIPLPMVTKMFHSSIYKSYSAKRRIYADEIHADIKSRAKALMDGSPEISKYPGGASLLRKMLNPDYDIDEFTKDLMELTVVPENIENPPSGIEGQLHEIAMLSNLYTLAKVGDELFTYSQLFGVLRKVKGKKWSADYVIRRIQELTNFPQFSLKDLREQYADKLLENFKLTSPEYQLAKDIGDTTTMETLEAAEKKFISKAETFWKADASRMWSASLTNSIVSRTIRQDFTPSNSSVFVNASPLTIPHVFSAYSILFKFKRLVEGAFAVHYPLVRDFVSSVKNSLQVATSFAEEKDNEFIQDEFIKFLSSGTTFVDGPNTIDLNVPPTKPKYVGEFTLTGIDAWAMGVAQNVDKLKSTSPNRFIREIEISNDYRGVPRLLITSDKESDPETFERIRQGMVDLYESNPEIAIDIFKYAALTQGLGFGRTSFSKIFPDSLLASFSRALDDRIDTVMPKNESGEIKTPIAALNLSRLRDVFAFQLIKNYPSRIKFLRGVREEATGSYINYYGSRSKVYFGKEEGPTGPIYFDRKYPRTTGVEYHQYINVFEKLFAKIETTEDFVYYRALPNTTSNKNYNFSPEFLEKEFALDAILNPSYGLEDSNFDTPGRSVYVKGAVQKYEEGDQIAIADFSTPFPKSIKLVTVSGVIKKEKGFEYLYNSSSDISTVSTRSDIQDKALLSSYILQGENRVNIIATSREGAIARAEKDRANTLGVVADYIPMSKNYRNILVLPLNDFNSLSPEEALANVLAVINEMPKLPKIVVEENVLSLLDSTHPKEALTIASTLNSRFGIVLPSLKSQAASSDPEFLQQYQRNVKKKEIIAKVLRNNTIEVDSGVHKIKDVTGKISPSTIVSIPNYPLPYALVLSVDKGTVTILPFDTPVFDQLTSANYTEKELNDLIDSTNKCL